MCFRKPCKELTKSNILRIKTFIREAQVRATTLYVWNFDLRLDVADVAHCLDFFGFARASLLNVNEM